MSINPVAGIDAQGTQNTEASNPFRPWPGVTPKPAPGATESGNLSDREIQRPQAPSEPQGLPEDEVKVQHDSVDGEIVIKYLDKAGDVILQVPSSQMVGVTRAIDNDFQEQAKVRRNEVAVNEGEKDHGY
jgi:hypothetical protein